MNILQINSSAQLGGAETVASQLRDGCLQAGHTSRLLVAWGKYFPRGKGVEPMYPRLLSRLYMSRFHRLTERFFPHFRWTDKALGRLAASSWDVIHVHSFHGDYARIETLADLAHRKPVVWTFHGCWGFTGGCDHTGPCGRYQVACGECPRVGRWSFLPSDNTAIQLDLKLRHFAAAPFHVVSPSRWLATNIKGSQVGSTWDVRVIPNGVDPQLFSGDRKHNPALRRELGLDPKAVVILLVNRNFKDETKGFAMAREALAAVPAVGSQVVFAGTNGDWAAASLPGWRSIAPGYLGSRERLARYYEVADILLFASPEENFPCAVVEAMSAGCCVVATPTGGVAEQIEHGRSGLLAAAISGPALATVLQAALAQPELRRTCGEAARQRVVREFSDEAMMARYLSLYDEVVAAAA